MRPGDWRSMRIRCRRRARESSQTRTADAGTFAAMLVRALGGLREEQPGARATSRPNNVLEPGVNAAYLFRLRVVRVPRKLASQFLEFQTESRIHMKHFRRSALLIVAAASFGSAAVFAAPSTEDSVWQNPQNSVHVRIHPCGASRCGTIIWANDKAKADSARGGTPNLVGTELFRDFHETSPKIWSGRVFVPDLNKVFSGTGTVLNSNTIVARGCLIKNIGCKSQTWTRVTSAGE